MVDKRKKKFSEKLKESFNVVDTILSQKNYLGLFLVVTLISFILFYWLTVVNVANASLDIFILMSGRVFTMVQLFLLLIISLLFGLYFSMAVFKYKLAKKFKGKMGFFASIGFFFGVFSAGCPTCGSAVFALFGAPLALMFLPWKGMELKILSIFILIVTNYFATRKLIGCEIK